MAERGSGLGIVAEPWRVPNDHPHWFADRDGSAAVYWRPLPRSPPCTRVEAGEGYVAVKWGPILVIAIYAPPRWDLVMFEGVLDAIDACIRRHPQSQVIVAGDFNAKSALWGSPRRNQRGSTLEEWAASLGLCLVNTGRKSTCVRRQRTSIVDLTWADPCTARFIREWGVIEDGETLSDHQLIEMVFQVTPPPTRAGSPPPTGGTEKMGPQKVGPGPPTSGGPGSNMGRS
ncbi:uncharacterized protein [Temnothorax nylanderi]|uniref:uncharacterized protein n=1 Tax=Temnothorax nylanderi TaxID=102681 RepID=UPI003A8391E2